MGSESGLAIQHAQEAVRSRLAVGASELVEHLKGRLGTLAGRRVLLLREEDLGVIEQTQPAELHVTLRCRELAATAVEAICVLPLAPVGADHAEVVVDKRHALTIISRFEGAQCALIVGLCLSEVATDIRQHAKVLPDPAAQARAAAAELERSGEEAPGRIVGGLLQLETGKAVEGLGRRHRQAGDHGNVVSLPAEIPTEVGTLPPPVVSHTQPPQRLGLECGITGVVRAPCRVGVVIGGLAQATGELMLPTERDQRARIDRAWCVLLGRAGAAIAH